MVVIQESHIHIISAEELQVVRTIEKLGALIWMILEMTNCGG